MSARQNALYRGGLLVSAGAVLWSLVQVLEAVCVPWVRGPEYAPLYAGQLRVFGVLGGDRPGRAPGVPRAVPAQKEKGRLVNSNHSASRNGVARAHFVRASCALASIRSL